MDENSPLLGDRVIPVAAPVLGGNERAYVLDCLDTTWISSRGGYVDRFEQAFADFCGAAHAVACCNGTAALHLALVGAGVGPGDEVIIPTLTFVSCANAVTYCGAVPRFVDSEPMSWNLDPRLLEELVTPRTKAIMAVHLYGNPADIKGIEEVASRHGLAVIEDAAEAHGASFGGRKVGSLGLVAAFSFFGNKIITTGEGGMVVTDDAELATLVRRLNSHGADRSRRYWYSTIGFNYRMTNVAAAIGLGQVESAEARCERYREVASWYAEELSAEPGLEWQHVLSGAEHAHWMVSVVLAEEVPVGRDRVIEELWERGIEARPVFYPMHELPPYRDTTANHAFPVADRIAHRGISLPTWAGLERADVEHVAAALRDVLRRG